MPIIFQKTINIDCQVMVWKIEENQTFFKDNLGEENYVNTEFAEITHPHKQLEWLASRYLAKYLAYRMDINYQGLFKDENSKPFLLNTEHHLSLSHTVTHVAAAIHLHRSIGIDLETISQRLHIIKHKFLTEIERQNANDNLEKLCVYWSAKESLYKLYGKRGVHFKDQLQVFPFEITDHILKGKINVKDILQYCEIYKYKIENSYLTIAF